MIDERAKLERLNVKVAAARELARIVFIRDVDLADLADAAAVSDSMPSRWASKKCGDAIALADVVLVGRKLPNVAHDLMRWAGEQLGLIVSKRIVATKAGDHVMAAAGALREASEAVTAYVEAAQQTDDEHLTKLHRELLEAEEALASVRAWVDAERDARAVPSLRARAGKAA